MPEALGGTDGSQERTRDRVGLCRHRRRLGRLRVGQPAQREQAAQGARARGRRDGSQPVCAHPGRVREDPREVRLGLCRRARPVAQRPRRQLARGQGDRRRLDGERHGLDPRPRGRLRPLGAGGRLPGVGLQERAALLPPLRALRGRGPPEPRRQGSAARQQPAPRPPHHPAVDRRREVRWSPLEPRSQHGRPGGGRLLPGVDAPRLAPQHGPRLPAPCAAPAQSHAAHQGDDEPHPHRGWSRWAWSTWSTARCIKPRRSAK